MRGRRAAIGLALAMLAAATIVIALMLRSPGGGEREILDTRLGELKMRLARAVASAERAVDGKAESIRLKSDSALSPWVIIIDAHGKKFDVVVDRSGAIVSTAEHATSAPTGKVPPVDGPSFGSPATGKDETK